MIQYNEYQDSQNPALQFLQKMGWEYISPKQTEPFWGVNLNIHLYENSIQIIIYSLEGIDATVQFARIPIGYEKVFF